MSSTIKANARVASKSRILVVDDDVIYGVAAIEVLEQAGFEALLVGTGHAAMTASAQMRPDAILLDVELPDANGFDLCAQLRSTHAGSDIPIVMVTGHNTPESIARAFQVGAADFINKPILWATLPHRIEFMLHAYADMRALRLSEQRNRALLQALPDTLLIVDSNGLVLEHITGEEIAIHNGFVGKLLDEVLPTENTRTAMECLKSATDTGVAQSYEFESGSGDSQKAYEARMRPQPNGTVLIVLRDATERRRNEARIQYLAYYDTLTGLPNRQLFVRELRRAIRAAEQAATKVALLYLDLDRFKRINDTLGHSVGDNLLQQVSRRLERSVRPAETVRSDGIRGGTHHPRIARLGGDEFVILLTGITEDNQAGSVADRVRTALSMPFECNGHRFVVTPSIGIVICPDDGNDIEDLLVKADLAMYRAKELGRNGHAFYGESMSIRSLGRLELEDDLRRAIEANDFTLYYQPKMDIDTGAIIGVEALLRWQHSDRGWIAPSIFIPLAEETGMIVPLGDWVIREACRQLKTWNTQGLTGLSISINVSTQQFDREEFVDSVLRTLWQHGIRPQQLEIEITESVLMRNDDDTISALSRLRSAGISLSIDDFGTGYSSLGYLKQFPVDALKIDRSFVKDLHTSGDDAAICAAIIAMARELRLKVVAEGVEVAEQLEFLRRHGCDQIQGFLISKPVPLNELMEILRVGSGQQRLRAASGHSHSSMRVEVERP